MADSFWGALREQARGQLIADAMRYTSTYRDVSGIASDGRSGIIMAGHQPTLFHPGVWFKNFALSRLAATHGALAINLVIDNDVAPPPVIRVPVVDPASGLAHLESVAYDTGAGGIPHEQTAIVDRDRFERFDRAVRRKIRPLVSDPCVTELWGYAREAVARCGVAGCALAQARHRLEGELGLQTLELPLGVVTRGPAFARFVIAILRDPVHFRNSYNGAVEAYRSVHGIRSKAHPVPNLAHDGDWIETPLWLYGNASPVRRSVWARRQGNRLQISDRFERQMEIEAGDEQQAAEALANAASPEFKLRPRALLTTMYARLVLSDLFLHGIGGGKYDQLGDMVMRAHLGAIPPRFMVISATHRLPVTGDLSNDEKARRLRREIRETFFHPERFAFDPAVEDGQAERDRHLRKRKQELLAQIPPRGARKAWHQELTAVNEQLTARLAGIRSQLQTRLLEARKQAVSEGILASREHPFCLYPLEELRSAFEPMYESVQQV